MQSRISLAAVMAGLLLISAVAPARAGTPITLLYTAVNSFIVSFVAKDQGYFEKHGLDVELSLATNGNSIPQALVGGSAQIGAPTPPVVLQADEQGLDLVVLAATNLYPITAGTGGMLARTGSDITGAKDLVGRKVGVPGIGGTNDVLTKNWIKAAGADYRKVTWIEVQFPQMGDFLKSGLVDAVSATNPFYARILDGKIGYDIGSYSLVVPAGTMASLYATTRSWATQNSTAVKSFRAAMAEAEAYIKDPAHQDSVYASLGKYTKLPPQAVAALSIPINLDAHARPEGLSFWIKVAHDQGLISREPDAASLIVPYGS